MGNDLFNSYHQVLFNQLKNEVTVTSCMFHVGRSRLEPMDTIFVKNVRERGPAHQGGLCTGKENVCLKENEMDGRLSVCRNSLICNGNNLKSIRHDHT